MVLRQSDIGDLYINEEMKALKCIRNGVDGLDESEPLAARYWFEEAAYHAEMMSRLKRRFESMTLRTSEGEEQNETRGR